MEVKIRKNELVDYEWHDAELENITIFLEGKIEIAFKMLRTYHKLDCGKIEIWASTATVLLTNTTGFSVDNIISDEYIDGELLNSLGEEVLLLPVTIEKTVEQFKIYAAGAGANIAIKASTAQFKNLKPLSYIQDYNS